MSLESQVSLCMLVQLFTVESHRNTLFLFGELHGRHEEYHCSVWLPIQQPPSLTWASPFDLPSFLSSHHLLCQVPRCQQYYILSNPWFISHGSSWVCKGMRQGRESDYFSRICLASSLMLLLECFFPAWLWHVAFAARFLFLASDGSAASFGRCIRGKAPTPYDLWGQCFLERFVPSV